jgi:hypothetical protein
LISPFALHREKHPHSAGVFRCHPTEFHRAASAKNIQRELHEIDRRFASVGKHPLQITAFFFEHCLALDIGGFRPAAPALPVAIRGGIDAVLAIDLVNLLAAIDAFQYHQVSRFDETDLFHVQSPVVLSSQKIPVMSFSV